RTRTNAAGVEQRACRAGPEGVSRVAANNRTQFDGESGRRKAKTRLWGGFFKSGARTRTNAAGVEQRACRAGPEGVSRVAANNRTQFDGESGCRKAKTRLWGGFFK
ncbi:hypothetical protein, partial [Klebsiella aerogenes]|uniref:hypothetical protein n=1 Tax=Klebsiella aerogenes TaxID=548 RepID=UPI001CC4FEF6